MVRCSSSARALASVVCGASIKGGEKGGKVPAEEGNRRLKSAIRADPRLRFDVNCLEVPHQHGMGFGPLPLLITEATTPCDRQVMVSDGVCTRDVTVSTSTRIVRSAAASGRVNEEI